MVPCEIFFNLWKTEAQKLAERRAAQLLAERGIERPDESEKPKTQKTKILTKAQKKKLQEQERAKKEAQENKEEEVKVEVKTLSTFITMFWFSEIFLIKSPKFQKFLKFILIL